MNSKAILGSNMFFARVVIWGAASTRWWMQVNQPRQGRKTLDAVPSHRASPGWGGRNDHRYSVCHPFRARTILYAPFPVFRRFAADSILSTNFQLLHAVPRILKARLSLAVLCALALTIACGQSQPGASPGESTVSKVASAVKNAVDGGGDFEGIIAMKMDTENQKGAELTYFLKGQHTRMEMKMGNTPEGQAVMLWDLDAAKITTLIPSRKMYMTMDLKETAESLKEATKEMKKSEDEGEIKFPKLTPTGRQETVAGYPCEHWLMGDQQEIDMCVAKGLGYFGMGSQTGGGVGSVENLMFNPKLLAAAAAHPEWVKFLHGGAFPLKLTVMKGGKVEMTIETTRIERTSLDDSLFTIPPDYKELNVRNLMGGKR